MLFTYQIIIYFFSIISIPFAKTLSQVFRPRSRIQVIKLFCKVKKSEDNKKNLLITSKSLRVHMIENKENDIREWMQINHSTSYELSSISSSYSLSGHANIFQESNITAIITDIAKLWRFQNIQKTIKLLENKEDINNELQIITYNDIVSHLTIKPIQSIKLNSGELWEKWE